MTQMTNIRKKAPETAEQTSSVSPAPGRFAHIVSVSGPQAVAILESSQRRHGVKDGGRIGIGSLVMIPTPHSAVVGIISAMSSPMPAAAGENEEIGLVELSLAGEIVRDELSGKPRFRRGVANFPSMGDAVMGASSEELASVYIQPDADTIEVGTLYQDSSVPARFLVDELFGKHFIVVGTTGSGKSSAVSCILQRVLAEHGHAHIVVLDIHNEYAETFGGKAELIHPSNLRLPFWLLNFQELCAALTSADGHRDAEVEILSDALVAAKRRYSDLLSGRLRRAGEGSGITVDTPSPFRLADVSSYIDEQLGKLDRTQATLPYRRLKARIEALVSDPRYGFMFGSLTVEDTMADVLGRIFRVPSEGRPITVIDLAAVPAEILDIVISLIARLAFELAVWSEGGLPLLLVCEEAHRYAPAVSGDRFLPTRQALARIAKEGRKYGVSLALVTQRPSELDTTIISQCSTAIAMRLSTDRDQAVMRANTHDSALDLMDYLPLLADREAIVLGQGVPMPMRIRFHDIGAEGVPRTRHQGFSHSWRSANLDREQLEEAVSRWRSSGRQQRG